MVVRTVVYCHQPVCTFTVGVRVLQAAGGPTVSGTEDELFPCMLDEFTVL